MSGTARSRTFGGGFFRPRMRALRDVHRDLEFEEIEGLRKQKFDILNEIRQLKVENDAIRQELEAKIKSHDESELAEIEVQTRTVTERDFGRDSQRVFTGSKKLLQLQSESLALDKHLESLRFGFSEDAEHRIKTSVCMQKNEIGNARSELSMYLDVLEQARAALFGSDMAQGVSSCDGQKERVRELRKELAQLQQEGEELEKMRDSEAKEKSATYRGDAEVGKLERRLANLRHLKEGRKKEMEQLKEKIEIQVSVMNGVHEKERTIRRSAERNKPSPRTRRYKPLGRKKMDGDGEELATTRGSVQERRDGGSSELRKGESESRKSESTSVSEKEPSEKHLSNDFESEKKEKMSSDKSEKASSEKNLSDDFESAEKNEKNSSETFEEKSSEKRLSNDFESTEKDKKDSSEKSEEKNLSNDFESAEKSEKKSSEKFKEKSSDKRLSDDFESAEKNEKNSSEKSEEKNLSDDFESAEKKPDMSDDFEKEASATHLDDDFDDSSGAKADMSNDFDPSAEQSEEKHDFSTDFE